MTENAPLEQLRARFAGTATVSAPLGEATVQVAAADLLSTLQTLKEAEKFEQLIDIAGVDYSQHAKGGKARFGVVYHLLSLSCNRRVRVRVFCDDDDFPALPSATSLWAAANWFEREAFDLYGIVFHGHDDLRRILTDYGFVGHPFRKDFPLSGQVEMRYDPARRRVVYEPVSIAPREVTPRIVREDNFAEDSDG